MQIKDSVVLVTGANRGLGLTLVHALITAGARKVYAAARNPDSIQIPGVTAIKLDVTSPTDIAAAAEACGDVSILINNAGILDHQGVHLLTEGSSGALNRELATNVFGPLHLSQAFAPILARNGGGAVLNILSVLSWISVPGAATYSISKAAAWSMTNGLRHELQAQNTQVTGLHVAYMDTDMAHGVTGAKTSPQDVARQALAALEAGQPEVLADDTSRQVRAGLSAEQAVYF
ncbi:SDR family oxidoreductase [Deinococcus aquiradiocola]|uniref:Short-chain dehydrogenase/reductase n=1 Tax=Deinococcus aquiradiocola TaxID=393059 RepID=A0A917PH79_9DEIO|nr:SDR family oxidoreductase [Deinococcus aquiradiocola]GGJ77715.1 short-chain dehydrogenase/reductase [Deinococcus aquiradiocola]